MTLILTQDEVRSLLTMPTCMEIERDALATLARGNAVNPLERGLRVPNSDGLLGWMPGFNESGDYLSALAEGAITEDHIMGEIGDVIIGKTPGRNCSSEVTLLESLGLAVEDQAAAHHVYLEALKRQMGTHVDLGGRVQ